MFYLYIEGIGSDNIWILTCKLQGVNKIHYIVHVDTVEFLKFVNKNIGTDCVMDDNSLQGCIPAENIESLKKRIIFLGTEFMQFKTVEIQQTNSNTAIILNDIYTNFVDVDNILVIPVLQIKPNKFIEQLKFILHDWTVRDNGLIIHRKADLDSVITIIKFVHEMCAETDAPVYNFVDDITKENREYVNSEILNSNKNSNNNSIIKPEPIKKPEPVSKEQIINHQEFAKKVKLDEYREDYEAYARTIAKSNDIEQIHELTSCQNWNVKSTHDIYSDLLAEKDKIIADLTKKLADKTDRVAQLEIELVDQNVATGLIKDNMGILLEKMDKLLAENGILHSKLHVIKSVCLD